MTTPTTLRRGVQVSIDTDLPYAGRPLRGRRGRIHRLGAYSGSVYVCTCATSSDFHATTCPADMPLRHDEVVRAQRSTRRDDGTAAVASVLLIALFGGLIGLALCTVLALGQRVMCHVYSDSISYCPGYTATHNQEPHR